MIWNASVTFDRHRSNRGGFSETCLCKVPGLIEAIRGVSEACPCKVPGLIHVLAPEFSTALFQVGTPVLSPSPTAPSFREAREQPADELNAKQIFFPSAVMACLWKVRGFPLPLPLPRANRVRGNLRASELAGIERLAVRATADNAIWVVKYRSLQRRA
eukprot:1087295-Amphidinium_carterae.2